MCYKVTVYYGENRISEWTVESASPRAAQNKVRAILAKSGKATKVKIKRMTCVEMKNSK